ncbi:Uncharacterised protein [Bordetella ansorpii]|uniref:Uncharacterized protein n=1 Tax=Bordetella ansorpii TaxID=288768 RepID=A0A157QUA8_9BORD|nr:Uncharacterised protein [Bordetella ansorpii]
MNASDLYALRERFDKNRTLLCFNGPISRSLIEEIGNALKNYLDAEHTRPAEAMDVFSVYIEMIQNIRQYALQCNDAEASATVAINRRDAGGYVVSAGNMVEAAHGERLVAIVDRHGRHGQGRAEGGIQGAIAQAPRAGHGHRRRPGPDRHRAPRQRSAAGQPQPADRKRPGLLQPERRHLNRPQSPI